MLPHRVPPARGQETARAHLRANVQAAAGASPDPGQWHLHHIALLDGPGDFTPVRPPEYVETELSPLGYFGELLEHLAEALGPDHARVIAERGLEAGR